MKRLSIIIPAHNEEKRIGYTLEKYCNFFKKSKENNVLDFEILIVINNTRDETEKIVQEFQNEFPEILYLNFGRGGKGFAIVEGFKDALRRNNDLIGFVDADCSTPPEAFYDLIKYIGNADGSIANRRDKRSKVTPHPILRRILSRGGNFIIRSLFLLPHRDTQCGAKLFKRELIEKVYPKLGSSEWSFDIDLLFYARREKAKIKSIPTVWIAKDGSHINLKKTPITVLLSVIRLRLIHSPFNFVIRVYRKLPDKLKFH